MVTFSAGGFMGAGTFSDQGFRIEFERKPPSPYELLRQDAIAIRGASVEAVHRTTVEVKEKIRDYMDAHFTGSEVHANNRRKVSNASAQDMFFDDIEGKGQYAGLVYSKFGKRDGGGFVDFLLLHMRGGIIGARRGGGWLRIVNDEVGGTARSAAQTGRFGISRSQIFFAKSADGRKLFQLRRYAKGSGIAGKAGKVELIATLMRQLVFKPRLSGIDEIAARRPELFEGHFAEALNARLAPRQGAE